VRERRIQVRAVNDLKIPVGAIIKLAKAGKAEEQCPDIL